MINNSHIMIKANRGMYIEQVVERTIDFYHSRNMCHLEKRQVPLQIIKRVNATTAIVKVLSKSYVDYFGTIKGKYIEFECKQTTNQYFDLNMLKKHQFNYLLEISKLENVYSFLIIYFEHNEKAIMIEISNLIKCYKDNKNQKIPYELIIKYGFKLDIIYPGILNLYENII